MRGRKPKAEKNEYIVKISGYVGKLFESCLQLKIIELLIMIMNLDNIN